MKHVEYSYAHKEGEDDEALYSVYQTTTSDTGLEQDERIASSISSDDIDPFIHTYAKGQGYTSYQIVRQMGRRSSYESGILVTPVKRPSL